MKGILALVLVSAATAPADGRVVQVVEHYAIEVPAGYVLNDISPKLMDFELYALADKRTGNVRCTLYVGSHPAFPKLRWSGKPTQSRLNGGTRKEFRSSNRVEGLMIFDDVTYKNSKGSPFQMIHYFANNLSAAEMQVVTAMLHSITVAKKDLE